MLDSKVCLVPPWRQRPPRHTLATSFPPGVAAAVPGVSASRCGASLTDMSVYTYRLKFYSTENLNKMHLKISFERYSNFMSYYNNHSLISVLQGMRKPPCVSVNTAHVCSSRLSRAAVAAASPTQTLTCQAPLARQTGLGVTTSTRCYFACQGF